MDMETYIVILNAPRLGRVGKIVREVATERGYDCSVETLDKTWLRETLRIVVTGSDLVAFRWGFQSTMAEYPTVKVMQESQS